MGPVIEAGVQRPFDQQGAEAGAVDEQVARDAALAIQMQGGDVAALAIQFDAGNAPFHPAGPVRFGPAAQEGGVKPGIELIGIVHPVVRQVGELSGQRRLQLQAVIGIGNVMAFAARPQPEMLEPGGPVILAGDAEGVEIAFPLFLPVFKADAQLEGGLRRPHELGLVDAEQAIEQDHRRDRAFAHADGADGVGFHQRQVDQVAHGAGQRRRRHPPGRAAAGNDDAQLALVSRGHRDRLLSRRARNWPAVSGVSGARMPRASAGRWSAGGPPSPKT